MKNKTKIISIFAVMVLLASVSFGVMANINATSTNTVENEKVVDKAYFFVTTDYSENGQSTVPTIYGNVYAINDSSNRKVLIGANISVGRVFGFVGGTKGKFFIANPGWTVTNASIDNPKLSISIKHETQEPEYETITIENYEALDSGNVSISIDPKDATNSLDECTIVVVLYRYHMQLAATHPYRKVTIDTIETDHVTVRF